MNRIPLFFACMIIVLFAPQMLASDRETVAVIGTGDMGDSFGPRLAELGYSVVYGSRSPDSEKTQALVARTGHSAIALSQLEAAQSGDIVILAVGWPAMETVARNLGDLKGKIVIDVSLPWAQGEDGYPVSSVATSSAEMIQQWNPGAKVVKAFGTMGSMLIDNPEAAGGMVTIPVASNHRDAKERVAQLVDELGLDPVDFGPLRMARFVEAMGLIYMIPLLQHQPAEWEFFFRRNADWVCRYSREWSEPVSDEGQLAKMPGKLKPPVPCPG
jgi:predicted dinucleotide-binding enzyme